MIASVLELEAHVIFDGSVEFNKSCPGGVRKGETGGFIA